MADTNFFVSAEHPPRQSNESSDTAAHRVAQEQKASAGPPPLEVPAPAPGTPVSNETSAVFLGRVAQPGELKKDGPLDVDDPGSVPKPAGEPINQGKESRNTSRGKSVKRYG